VRVTVLARSSNVAERLLLDGTCPTNSYFAFGQWTDFNGPLALALIRLYATEPAKDSGAAPPSSVAA